MFATSTASAIVLHAMWPPMQLARSHCWPVSNAGKPWSSVSRRQMDAAGLVNRLEGSDASPTAVNARAPAAFVRHVIAVVDAPTLLADLSGDDLLHDRRLASSERDRRSVAEAVIRQVEYADALQLSGTEDSPGAGPPAAQLRQILARLNPAACLVDCPELLALVGGDQSAPNGSGFDGAAARARVEPGVVSAPLDEAVDGVTTVVWRANRPMHPAGSPMLLTTSWAECCTAADGSGWPTARPRCWPGSRPGDAPRWAPSVPGWPTSPRRTGVDAGLVEGGCGGPRSSGGPTAPPRSMGSSRSATPWRSSGSAAPGIS